MATESQIEGNIESLAEQAARELLGAVPALKTAQPIDRNALIAMALHAAQGSAARLVAAFSGDSSFGYLRNGWIQCGGSGMRMQGHMFPHLLINSVIEGHSTKSLVEEARAFADSRTSVTESYSLLSGATVAKAVSLDHGIDLVPWVDVPEGKHKTLFCPNLSASLTHMQAMPNSALRTRSPERQVLFSSYDDAKEAIETAISESTARDARIQDVVRCIAAQSVCPVAVVGSWVQLYKKIANDVSGIVYSYSEALFDNMLRMTSFSPVVLDCETIARLAGLFEVFNSSEKRVMWVALDRLNQALRRQNAVDKAIDLGVALEVMLLHELGNKYRGELRFRLAIRGAAFLGGDKLERREIFELLQDVYDLRSQAVHSGDLRSRKTGPPAEQILSEATGTCARIARSLIELGSFPDWDAEYVIGGQ